MRGLKIIFIHAPYASAILLAENSWIRSLKEVFFISSSAGTRPEEVWGSAAMGFAYWTLCEYDVFKR